MIKSLLRLFLSFTLFSVTTFAQTPAKESLWLAPVCKPKLYGLQNNQGEVAVECKFDYISEQDGKAWIVTTKGKQGVINSKGEYLIRPNFETITQYANGRAIAGKRVKRVPYENSSDGMFSYSDSIISYGVIDETGTWIIDPAYSWMMISPDGSIEFTDKNQQYGFLNPDGTVLLRAQFYYASVMFNGVAIIAEPASQNNYKPGYNLYDSHSRIRQGNYFLINRTGEKLTATPYDLIRNFSEDRAAFNKGGIWKQNGYGEPSVLSGGKWGFLDAKGNEAVAANYDYVYDYENGKAKVRVGEKTFWIDKDGKECAAPTSTVTKEFTVFCETGHFGYIDLKGKWIIEPQFYIAENFSEGLAAAIPLRASDMNCTDTKMDGNNNDYGDDDYSFRVLPSYDVLGINENRMNLEAQRLVDSLNMVERNQRRLYGYIDATGNFILPPKYESAFPFIEGRAYVCFRGKWGVIDKTGKWIMAPVLETPPALSYSSSIYGDEADPYHYEYNNRDYLRASFTMSVYNYPLFGFSEGLGGIYKYGKFGFIDTTGKIIVAPVYDEALPFSQGLAAVRLGEKWGYIDKTGKEIIPLRFRNASSFTKEGLAMAGSEPATSDGTLSDTQMEYESDNNIYYGYIDKTGKWIIKPQFTHAENFSEGLAAASLDYGNRGYIDKTGKFVIPPKYDNAGPFTHGYALVKIRMYQPVYIDKTGKINKSLSAEHGIFDKSVPLAVDYDSSSLYGYVNEKREEVIPHIYRAAGNFVKVK
jgi:hypothetical protein